MKNVNDIIKQLMDLTIGFAQEHSISKVEFLGIVEAYKIQATDFIKYIKLDEDASEGDK